MVNWFSNYFTGVANPGSIVSIIHVSINRMSSFINPASCGKVSHIILGLENASSNTNEMPALVTN